MVQVQGNHPVTQRVLAPVDTCILLRITGKDSNKVRVNSQVSLAATCGRHVHHLLLKDGQEYIVSFGPRPGKFVVYQGKSVFACNGQPIVYPGLIHIFLGLKNGMDEVVYDLLHPVAVLATYQVRGSVFFVAVYYYNRPPYHSGQMHGKGCLAGAGGAPEMDRKTGFHVPDSTLRNTSDVLRLHKIRQRSRIKHG